MKIEVTPRFERDLKKVQKKHYPTEQLKEVIELIESDTEKSDKILTQRHNKHTLKGK